MPSTACRAIFCSNIPHGYAYSGFLMLGRGIGAFRGLPAAGLNIRSSSVRLSPLANGLVYSTVQSCCCIYHGGAHLLRSISWLRRASSSAPCRRVTSLDNLASSSCTLLCTKKRQCGRRIKLQATMQYSASPRLRPECAVRDYRRNDGANGG